MIKQYQFSYDAESAYVNFTVDTEKFTKDLANATLNFFSWDYDKKADPIDEVLRKYAAEALRFSAYAGNSNQVEEHFNGLEGFAKVDGSLGLKMTYIQCIEIDADELQMKVAPVITKNK